jgi:plastocyanin
VSDVDEEGEMVRTVSRSIVVAGVLGLVLVLPLAPVALAVDHAVDIAGFAFSPGSVTVAVGDTVTWSNADAQNHTATANDDSFDTGTIGGGTSKSVTLSTAGTFAYHCKIHPSMTGTIVVQAAAAPPPTDVDAVRERSGGDGAALLVAAAVVLGFLLGARRFRWVATKR